jgi:predicted double-glycine peptidase
MPDDLQPMIVYLVVKGYRHFAVFSGLENGLVVLRDPARGRIRVTAQRFLSEWDGSALILTGPNELTAEPNEPAELTAAQFTARSAVFPRLPLRSP